MLTEVDVFHIIHLCHSHKMPLVKSISRERIEVLHKVCQIWAAHHAFWTVRTRVRVHVLPIVNEQCYRPRHFMHQGRNGNRFGALVLVGRTTQLTQPR
jgi:hypothetical protein